MSVTTADDSRSEKDAAKDSGVVPESDVKQSGTESKVADSDASVPDCTWPGREDRLANHGEIVYYIIDDTMFDTVYCVTNRIEENVNRDKVIRENLDELEREHPVHFSVKWSFEKPDADGPFKSYKDLVQFLAHWMLGLGPDE